MCRRHHSVGLCAIIGLVSSVLLWGCGPGQTDSERMVPVQLSIVVDHQEARGGPAASGIVAFLQRWIFGPTIAWAQSVSDIATITVTISAPDIATPRTATVSVSDPDSGDTIPVQIEAPVGENRTIAVAALNAAGRKIYSGSTSGVTLPAGGPIEVRLARTFTVTVQKQGDGNGTVTSTPAGLDCGGTCSAPFDAGTPVVLSAAASPGSSFGGWSGASCGGTGSCTVSNTATVVAIFNTAANTSRLAVTKSGSGTGTVTSNPSGINCGDGCIANFPTGSTVALAATPTGGSTFVGWSGSGCSGTGACVVAMNGDRAVTAQFSAAPSVRLTIEKTGNGTVTSAPPGIGCGSTCSANFTSGSSVALTATPTGGATFGSWGGACSGTGACTVVMNGPQTVTATFIPPAPATTLTVEISGTGSGTVTSAPAGINGCTATCSANFPLLTDVTLTASPTGGSTFAGWNGAGCSGTGPCTVDMTSSQTVTATFAAPPPSTAALTVTKAGMGTGTVSSSPGGINCGNDCSGNFPSGSSVTLTATATGGSTFAGWSGGCGGTGTCTVAMNGPQTRTATFNPPVGMATLTVSRTGTGDGTVTSSPGGINCGNDCSGSFPGGSTVTLNAVPAIGSTFVGWSGGGCSGTGTCETVMAGSETVIAQFDANPGMATLTVNKSGPGEGTVTSSPSGINCGATCVATFTIGTTVTLSADPDSDSEFDDWSGSGCNGDGACVIEMNGNRSVTARFDDD